ncbi:MAG: choice-of-anchor R domain-containing protein [Rhizomicrobium sp.]
MLEVRRVGVTFLALALALAGSMALAAGKKPVSFKIDGATVLAGPAIRPFVKVAPQEPGVVKVFDNLPSARKYPYGTYFCCLATEVAGPDNGYNPQQWWAEAFTPSTNATVTKIEVAVTYMVGTNGVKIGLYSDANGVPGAALIAKDVTNLPPFGGCCATMVLKDKDGIAATAGTQYWVVLSTDSNNDGFLGSWNYNSTDQVTKINQAINTGSGWQGGSYYPGVGLAVWGK